MKNRSTGRLGGFTLIELLVVVLIIGILAAVALPQYTKAVHKARFAENLMRIKSFEEAIDLYVAENGCDNGTIDLGELNPGLVNGLAYAPNGTIPYYRSKYGMYYVLGNSPYNCGEWHASYYDGSGTHLAEVFGSRSKEDMMWYRYCWYEEDIGKALCAPLASQGYEVEEGF